ncbi:MAG: glycoside hydrolase family 88 protein [Firmicutes bacterium]|nr:glycoside hydrolase family 88 protein [Bacillota bacterium]
MKIKIEDKKWANEIWAKVEEKLLRTAVSSREKLPYTTIKGIHNDCLSEKDIHKWTNGFWPGLMWLMYADTKNAEYRKTAERAEELLDGALINFEALDHDVGFIWHISSGVNYRLAGNEQSKNRALFAAASLASRFNLKGNYIRAWPNRPEADTTGWTIIDSMMNLPLLYWASKHLKDNRFRWIAEAHANKTITSHIRPDGSVNHIVSHDPLTGEIIETLGGQGYGVGSCWSRGQAWAVYGFILSYIHTGNIEYLNAAKSTAHYFISNLKGDYLTLCDFRSPAEPAVYDSTAGAIAACGLIELANNVPELERGGYIDAAIKILKALESKRCNWDDNEDSILQMGTEAYHKKTGRHIPIIYGDYFFVEALYKLRENEFLFW